MASLAVTFGSFGDIVVVIDLVSKLCTALSDVHGAPAEIASLRDDLRRYNGLLPLLQTSLRADEAGFVQQTREAIEAELKDCRHSLDAIERSINGVSSRIQNCAGPAVMGAYFAAARWRLLGGSKKVKALHTRLEKHFSFLEKYLHIGTSNGQREIHRVANETKVSLAVLVSSIDQPHSQVVSFLELRDQRGKISCQAFTVMPFRFLATYLEPLFILDGHPTEKQLKIVSEDGFFFPVHSCLPGEVYDLDSVGLISRLQLADFIADNGEPHRLIGVPPEFSSDPASRLISDVLEGRFHDNVNLGLYDEDLRKARYIHSTVETYNHILAIVDMVFRRIPLRDDGRDSRDESWIEILQTFPDPEFLKLSPVLQDAQTVLSQRYAFLGAAPQDRRALEQLFGLLNNAPKIPEAIIPQAELRGSIVQSFVSGTFFVRNPVTALLVKTALGAVVPPRTVTRRIRAPPTNSS